MVQEKRQTETEKLIYKPKALVEAIKKNSVAWKEIKPAQDVFVDRAFRKLAREEGVWTTARRLLHVYMSLYGYSLFKFIRKPLWRFSPSQEMKEAIFWIWIQVAIPVYQICPNAFPWLPNSLTVSKAFGRAAFEFEVTRQTRRDVVNVRTHRFFEAEKKAIYVWLKRYVANDVIDVVYSYIKPTDYIVYAPSESRHRLEWPESYMDKLSNSFHMRLLFEGGF